MAAVQSWNDEGSAQAATKSSNKGSGWLSKIKQKKQQQKQEKQSQQTHTVDTDYLEKLRESCC